MDAEPCWPVLEQHLGVPGSLHDYDVVHACDAYVLRDDSDVSAYNSAHALLEYGTTLYTQ